MTLVEGESYAFMLPTRTLIGKVIGSTQFDVQINCVTECDTRNLSDWLETGRLGEKSVKHESDRVFHLSYPGSMVITKWDFDIDEDEFEA